MWNSPNARGDRGKIYRREELTVLFNAASDVIGELPDNPDELVGDIAREEALRHLKVGQLLCGLQDVFEAMLQSDRPLPGNGHPGYQEAIVGELLLCARERVGAESDMHSKVGYQDGVWQSLTLLCPEVASGTRKGKRVSSARWDELFELLYAEFLWDTDWRCEALQRGPDHALKTFQVDRQALWQQPPIPSTEKVSAAATYLRDILREE